MFWTKAQLSTPIISPREDLSKFKFLYLLSIREFSLGISFLHIKLFSNFVVRACRALLILDHDPVVLST